MPARSRAASKGCKPERGTNGILSTPATANGRRAIRTTKPQRPKPKKPSNADLSQPYRKTRYGRKDQCHTRTFRFTQPGDPKDSSLHDVSKPATTPHKRKPLQTTFFIRQARERRRNAAPHPAQPGPRPTKRSLVEPDGARPPADQRSRTDKQSHHVGATKQSLVEPDGIEPTTSCLQSRRSPN